MYVWVAIPRFCPLEADGDSEGCTDTFQSCLCTHCIKHTFVDLSWSSPRGSSLHSGADEWPHFTMGVGTPLLHTQVSRENRLGGD